MKYFIAIALIATVASAAVRPTPVSAEITEIQEIIAAIQSPSTDPATAAALTQMLFDVLGVKPQPVAIGPALIDFPLPDGGAVAEEPTIVPSPAVVAPAPAASAPLVQITLNINQAAAEAAAASPINVGPAIIPTPVHVVDVAPEPVQVVEVAPEPVQVVEVAPEADEPVQVIEISLPVQVVDTAPVAVEPVLIGVPIIPEAAVVLPEQLN